MSACPEFPWLSFYVFLGLVVLALCGAFQMGKWHEKEKEHD